MNYLNKLLIALIMTVAVLIALVMFLIMKVESPNVTTQLVKAESGKQCVATIRDNKISSLVCEDY